MGLRYQRNVVGRVPGGQAESADFGPGDIKQGFGHHVEQIGSEPTRFLAMFNSPFYQEISLSSWLAANPSSMVATWACRRPKSRNFPSGRWGIIG